MATGAVATIVYGEPRLTTDIDLVVAISPHDVSALAAAFASPQFYFPPSEVLAAEIAKTHGGHFNIIHSDTTLKADIYPAAADELNRWGLEHRRRIVVDEETVWVAPPEYVIIRKLEYWRDGGSEKHARDIRSILDVLGPDVDRETISREVVRRDLAPQWESVRVRG
jgi:hypothetical protein